jgi:hypothetical protein
MTPAPQPVAGSSSALPTQHPRLPRVDSADGACTAVPLGALGIGPWTVRRGA